MNNNDHTTENLIQKVFVTGIGMISPVGLSRGETWDGLVAGKSGIETIESFDPSGLETTIAAEVKKFDPTEYIDRKSARRMDRFVQFATVAALEAMNHSQLKITSKNAERVSVIISSGIGGIITLEQQIGVLREKGAARVSPFLVPMMLPDMASGQVSMLLGAKGPNFATVSACSSGADALGVAFEMVRRGDVDVAITGGAEAAICPVGVAGFNACKALSKRNDNPSQASRPFDAKRDGFVLGEGAGVIVIESQQNVEQRSGHPLAEMIGYGSTADAHHITQPGPAGEGGARAMNIALRQSGIDPEEVCYINAHGTSTPLNDKAETQAMKSVFGNESYKIPISSTKSMTGHLLGAAGALEAAIAIMSIKKGVVPPTINLEFPDLDCDLDYTPHVPKRGRVRVAMSNSFGFGGHNASLLFREVSL